MDTVDERYSWKSELQVNAKGVIIGNLSNAIIALRECPELAGIFAFDALQQQLVLRGPIPGGVDDYLTTGRGKPRGRTPFAHRPLRDADVLGVTDYLQRTMTSNMSKGTVGDAIDLVAHEHEFDPLLIYLNSLSWDGIGRIDSWLADYLGADQDGYASRIGAMFLISMIARAYEGGCQADHLLILEGPQGTGKSSACRILGNPWFSDSLPDLSTGKDAAQHLRGKWLIEIAELSAFNRAEAHQLKAFCTRRVERYRPPYGRLETIEPRRVIFIGSTNAATYLRDETGNRRFWPVATGTIDLAKLALDRDQLLAEAVRRYRKGEHWWPDQEFERTIIADQQSRRMIVDPWLDLIETYVSGRNLIMLFEIGNSALGLSIPQMTTPAYARIRACLQFLGWVPCRPDSKTRRAQWRKISS